MKSVILASALAVGALMSSAAQAAPSYAYADGLQIVVFDKLFTFNSCSFEFNGAVEPSCAGFAVRPNITNLGPTFGNGYGFDITGLLAATGGGGVPTASDLNIDYSVQICGTTINGVTADCGSVANKFHYDPSVTGGHITDAHLFITGGVSHGSGFITGDELFKESNGTADGAGLHVAMPPGPSTANTFLPDVVQFLDVSKDIGILCLSTDCIANVSGVTQLFTQDVQGHHQSFPEPGSLALVGTGLAGLGGYLTRRRRRS